MSNSLKVSLQTTIYSLSWHRIETLSETNQFSPPRVRGASFSFLAESLFRMGAYRVSPKFDSNAMTEPRKHITVPRLLPQLTLGTTLLCEFGILVL